MRKIKARPSQRPTPQRSRAKSAPPMSRHGEELMELAVEAAQSRHLPDFLEQFALRATRMLDATWGGVAVHRGRETELHAVPGPAVTTEAAMSWLISCSRKSQGRWRSCVSPQVTMKGSEPSA